MYSIVFILTGNEDSSQSLKVYQFSTVWKKIAMPTQHYRLQDVLAEMHRAEKLCSPHSDKHTYCLAGEIIWSTLYDYTLATHS